MLERCPAAFFAEGIPWLQLATARVLGQAGCPG
jgi:hypothetical protein